MPVYDYLCTACDHRADIFHGINDPGPLYCPSCGAPGTMRKQFSAPSIHFKGSGWAKKDRGSASSTRAAAKSASTTESAGGSGGSGEPSGGPGQSPGSSGSSGDSTSSTPSSPSSSSDAKD